MKKTASSAGKPMFGLRLFLLTVAAGAVGIVIGIFSLYRYTPGAYQPPASPNSDQISPYLTHELAPDFLNRVQLDKSFELIIKQDGLNEIISQQDWPAELGEITFDKPMVIFANRAIYLMGTVNYRDLSSVATVQAQPVLNPDGRLRLNIQSIRLGLLPVTTLVGTLVQQILDANQEYFSDQPQLAAVIEAIIRSEPFEPVFTIYNYTVRLSRFHIEEGILKLYLEPVRP
ncbi:MAG: hypothetical protein KBI46_05585 [Phycisphaerae bacterium]|nr:hypothetical protein [Phycisphaerae bacterium]